MWKQGGEEVEEGFFAFAGDDDVRAAFEILFGMVGHVRARDKGDTAARFGGGDHREGGLAHAQQRHLAQIVEIVFIEDGDARFVLIERGVPLGGGVGQHGVEQRDVVTGAADDGGGIERAERRIGLHGLIQLRIEFQVIGLAEKDIGHGGAFAVGGRYRL